MPRKQPCSAQDPHHSSGAEQGPDWWPPLCGSRRTHQFPQFRGGSAAAEGGISLMILPDFKHNHYLPQIQRFLLLLRVPPS